MDNRALATGPRIATREFEPGFRSSSDRCGHRSPASCGSARLGIAKSPQSPSPIGDLIFVWPLRRSVGHADPGQGGGGYSRRSADSTGRRAPAHLQCRASRGGGRPWASQPSTIFWSRAVSSLLRLLGSWTQWWTSASCAGWPSAIPTRRSLDEFDGDGASCRLSPFALCCRRAFVRRARMIEGDEPPRRTLRFWRFSIHSIALARSLASRMASPEAS